MPRYRKSFPSYRKHKASGQAIVKIAGRMYYLGTHGTKASKTEYDRLVAGRSILPLVMIENPAESDEAGHSQSRTN